MKIFARCQGNENYKKISEAGRLFDLILSNSNTYGISVDTYSMNQIMTETLFQGQKKVNLRADLPITFSLK